MLRSRTKISGKPVWHKFLTGQFLGIYDNTILIPTYWTPQSCYKTQISDLPEAFTAVKVCWNIWSTVTNNWSNKCGWYWVWVWQSLECSIETNFNGLLRYLFQSFCSSQNLGYCRMWSWLYLDFRLNGLFFHLWHTLLGMFYWL